MEKSSDPSWEVRMLGKGPLDSQDPTEKPTLESKLVQILIPRQNSDSWLLTPAV